MYISSFLHQVMEQAYPYLPVVAVHLIIYYEYKPTVGSIIITKIANY